MAEGVEAPRDTEDDGRADPAPSVDAESFGKVLALTGRLLVGNLIALVTPVALLSVLVTATAGAAVLLRLDGRALIINGELLLDEPRQGLLVTGLALTALVMAAHLVMLAMVVVMSAGILLDRPVATGSAMRRAVRRSGPLLVLLTLACAAVLVVTLLAALTPLAGTWAYVPLVAVVAAAAACLLLLTVPIVVLENAGPLRASIRLWQIAKGRRMHMMWSPLLIAVVPPALLSAGARWIASYNTGMEHSPWEVGVLTVISVLTVVVQGTALTVVTLNQSLTYWDESGPVWRRRGPSHTMDLDEVAARLPAPAEARRRRPARAAVLAALAVLVLASPGVLYHLYVEANPVGLPDVDYRRTAPAAFEHRLTLLEGDRVAVLGKSRDQYDDKIQVCDDRGCPGAAAYRYPRLDAAKRVRATGLPDGSMAVAWIRPEDGSANRVPDGDDPRPMAVRLMRCTDRDCQRDLEKTPVIARGHAADITEEKREAAVAVTTSGQGVLAAVLLDAEKDGDDERTTLRIVRCADMACTEPRTLMTTRLETTRDWYDDNDAQLEITTGAGGRPVVAFENYRNGAVTLVGCDDADCRRPVTRRLVGPSEDGDYEYLSTNGVGLAVPLDDHPVLTHRRIQDGQIRLLRCRTRDCAAVDAVPLAEPGPGRGRFVPAEIWPNHALALGRDGLPLIATYDIDRGKLILLACREAACTRRDTVVLLHDIAARHRLDMEVGRDGRPRVLRYGIQFEDHVGAALLTCRDVRCGA
ncbi:hypothetical protein [Actinomadura rugatobispora]|uniref:ABC transporter permease n=1 Tax=Actinomadura rugatobispora TaxID=1994 RepID=A0ABW0ZYB2_9ACTN|nr:hypothetical protein GCM10010200_009320 [Actinomadura rugatobispora]